MNFDDYQYASQRTLNPSLSKDRALANYGLGLAGEAGEVVELLKKHLFHGRVIDTAALSKELGDVLWYVAALATENDLSLGDIAVENIKKLKARHPCGFVVT